MELDEPNITQDKEGSHSDGELKLNTSGNKIYSVSSVKATFKAEDEGIAHISTKRRRGRPKKDEVNAAKLSKTQLLESPFHGRAKRKSSLGLKKVLESVRGIRQEPDEEDIGNNSTPENPPNIAVKDKTGDSTSEKLEKPKNTENNLPIKTLLETEPPLEKSVEGAVDTVNDTAMEDMDPNEDQVEMEQNTFSFEESLSDEEEDFSDAEQVTSDLEDEHIQLQLMQQLKQEQLDQEEEFIQEQSMETSAEKKKYIIPKDTLNFLKNVKKAKKKEKINVTVKGADSPQDIAKKVLDEILDEVDGKKHLLVTHVRRGGYSLPENMSSLAKFALAKKRKKGEPSERSVLFKYSQHEERGWYVCPRENCNFRSRHSKNVYTHEKRHNGNYPYMCSLCGKRFILKKNYRIHQDAHQDLRPYQCQECGKWFRNMSNLQRHNLVHTGEKPFQCEVESCQVAFKDKINLKKHIALVHEGKRPYECTALGCTYVAYDRHALDKHKVKHKDLQDRPSETCTICGKVLYGTRSLQSHMLIHKGESYECTFCDYTTVFKQALQAHCMRKHYMDLEGNHVERKFKCKQCDFATFWEHDLRFHVTKHGAYKPFKCPICDYSTVLKGSLQKHMRLHTGEQPYACHLCGKSYTNQSGLARHKRSHTGEKPHKCDICGKKYADMKTLRNHRYSHLNLKPFMCPLCNYNCTKKDVLLTHYKRVHGEGNIPDNIRPKPFQRVIMRVTSGQTADEIISNIAPPGKGERQFLVMGGAEGDDGIHGRNIGGLEGQDEKFLVIHEDEAHTLNMLQDSQSLQNEALSSESVFRIIQTGDGQATVDSLSKNLDILGDDSRKVMKIATAPKTAHQSEKFFQRVHVTPGTSGAPLPPEQHALHIPQFPNLEALGSNFVLVQPSGTDNRVLQTLQLQPKNQLIAIPASQSSISDIVNEALSSHTLGLGNSGAEMNEALQLALQQAKTSTSSVVASSEIHLTHPILQSQLKREPDNISMIHTLPVSESSAPQAQQNTVLIQVQGNSDMDTIERDLVTAPSILPGDLQSDLMVKTEGTSALTNEIQKLQENLAVTGPNQLEFVTAGPDQLSNEPQHMDITQHLLGEENQEKFVLQIPEGTDLNPKDGPLEIMGIDSGEYVIAYLQSDGTLSAKQNLTVGENLRLSERQIDTLSTEEQSKILTPDNQVYFQSQNEASLNFKSVENQDHVSGSNIVSFNAGNPGPTSLENSMSFKTENRYEMDSENSLAFVTANQLQNAENKSANNFVVQTHAQQKGNVDSLSFTAHNQSEVVGDNTLSFPTDTEVNLIAPPNHGDGKVDIEQLEKQLSDMSQEMLIETAEQTTSGVHNAGLLETAVQEAAANNLTEAQHLNYSMG